MLKSIIFPRNEPPTDTHLENENEIDQHLYVIVIVSKYSYSQEGRATKGIKEAASEPC